ncbi:VOC family protein [Amycolatopsis alba]|uniref:Glyoxalase/bleomycin resistance/dioxygenase family protein n=1 Tax=Amycolatopsis alba DSM 44262 TaxID=1125972 RepID=A0A229RD60_AMYAL|nr:VOC family protein [Amycolatopsis alba]OXM44364.1 glyoxalase/bleomycin resistance/dioxygenase family protein [Amycolatopsis alba DSM 44262]
MTARLVNLVFDSALPRDLAGFWEGLFSWDAPFEPAFRSEPGAKQGKNRLHLDLASRSPEHQAELVDRALSLGARHTDVGQGPPEEKRVPWVVLADPEGNEFCVLEPREQYAGTGAIASVVIDALDPERLARFWSAALGWEIGLREATIVGLRPPDGRGPWVEFLATSEEKRRRNRLRFEIAPRRGGSRAAEVRRLRALGATGQNAEAMADPEGNEFGVLTPR